MEKKTKTYFSFIFGRIIKKASEENETLYLSMAAKNKDLDKLCHHFKHVKHFQLL